MVKPLSTIVAALFLEIILMYCNRNVKIAGKAIFLFGRLQGYALK
jgi:hypothetical protein